MSKYGKGIIQRLHPLSPLQNENNDGHKVIDNTIGEYLDRFEAKDIAHQLFLLHATGKFLDLHGEERGILRKTGETDDAYRERILLEKGMYNCLDHFRKMGVEFWDYVEHFAEGSQEFFVHVTNDEDEFLGNRKVSIYAKNLLSGEMEEYESYTNSFGFAYFNIPDLANLLNFECIVAGDSEYGDAVFSMESQNNVSWKRNTILLCNDSDIIRHQYFKVKLLTVDGVAIAGRKVTMTINNVSYNTTTDAEGIAMLQINLLENDYNIFYEFAGDDSFNSCSGSTQLLSFSKESDDLKNMLVDIGVLNDISSSTITSKNTYLNNEYFAHSNLTTQRKLSQKFINEGITWF